MKVIDLLGSLLISIKAKHCKKRKRQAVGGLKKELYSKTLRIIVGDEGEFVGVSPDATIEKSAIIDPSASIAPGVYVGDGVRIGANSRILPNATILHNTIIGEYVSIGPGAVVGGDGYGYYKEKGSNMMKHVPQIGNVEIQDYVEIGSNACIDRAAVGSTVIGYGTKINNLVHIAHNVKIGRNCLIMVSVSISGSTLIGDNVVVNPQASISKHIKIGENAEIGMNSTVIRDVQAGVRVIGSPAVER